MPLSDYHFITPWRLEAETGAVYDLIAAAEDYPRWMKDIKIKAVMISPGDKSGIGRKDQFEIRGFLPYSLCWQTECLEAERPHRIVSRASGDLAGTGTWTFVQRRMWTDVTFDWQVSLNQHPLLNSFAFLLRPLFEWNHDWVMQRWEKSLREELRKCQG